MEGWHQRRALATRCDIAAAEITDDGNAGQLSQQGGVANLHGEAACRFMANGLTVAADSADGVGLELLLSEEGVNT